MGIIIHSLESVSFKDLYAAFSSAFKDYDFSLNADELRRMLDRRGYWYSENYRRRYGHRNDQRGTATRVRRV